MELKRSECGTCIDNQTNSNEMVRSLVVALGALLSFATASICIALVALYHETEAVLIIMACSNITHGLISISATIILRKLCVETSFEAVRKLISIFIQLVTMGAAVEYFNYTQKHIISPRDDIHNILLVALNSLLISSLFISGMTVGFSRGRSHVYNNGEARSEGYCQHSERFVPLKNSSQTLTPSLDLFQTINPQFNDKSWPLGELPPNASSDEVSFPSVLKHKLTARDTSSAAVSRKSSNSNGNYSLNNQKKSSFVSRLRTRRSKSIKVMNQNSQGKQDLNETKNIDDRYVTRLSTIPDISRSILNFINSSSGDIQTGGASRVRNDKTNSQLTENSKVILNSPDSPDLIDPSMPTLELEKNAIERINSVLLPPCLSDAEPLPASNNHGLQNNDLNMTLPNLTQTVDNKIMIQMSPDVLQKNDLTDIPKIPAANDENISNFSTDFNCCLDPPQVVTLDMWEKNKSSILQRADSIQQHVLLPAFQFTSDKVGGFTSDGIEAQSNFSYPHKKVKGKYSEPIDTDINQCATISAVEDFFNDISENDEEESQLIEDALKHDQSSSFVMEKSPKELIRTSTRHSPTKSIISIISGSANSNLQRGQTLRSGHVSGSTDVRSLSQANNFFSSTSNIITNSPSKSSPSRSQRLRRIGKKLSMSNISDSMINNSMNLENSTDQINIQKSFHNRGRSIDFTYVHSLQSNHSPTKSSTGSIFKDRRHSLAAENNTRAASGLFYLQAGNLRSGYDPNDILNTTLKREVVENRVISNTSSDNTIGSSIGSGTDYPEIVTGEYDRERWNTLLSLDKIHMEGLGSKS